MKAISGCNLKTLFINNWFDGPRNELSAKCHKQCSKYNHISIPSAPAIRCLPQISAVITFTVVAFYNQTCYSSYFWFNVCRMPSNMASQPAARQSLTRQTEAAAKWISCAHPPIPHPLPTAPPKAKPPLDVKPTSELIKSQSDVSRCQKT